MPRPSRPPPSIRIEPMFRRASWAATIVPEKPPPMMATSASDIIVGPLLRLARSRPDLLDVIVGFGDGASRRVREPARDEAVDHGRAAGEDQLPADLECSRAMCGPGQSQRPWMFDEQPVQHCIAPFFAPSSMP